MTGNRLGVLLCLSVLLALPAAGQVQPGPSPAPPAAGSQPPPPKPGAAPPRPAVPSTDENATSLEVFYWLTHGHPNLVTGRANTGPNPADLAFPSKTKGAPGAILSFPAGRENSFRISYFRSSVAGSTTTPQDLTVFSQAYNKGDYLDANYILTNVKVSFDYLSYPFPVRNSRFRLRTYWEGQYTSISSTFNAPLKPTADSAGNPISNSTRGAKSFYYPSLGIGLGYVPSQKVRFEAKASGFAFPHRSTVWDAQATLSYRFRKFELALGAKAFHFRTSPRAEEYFRATLFGPYVGLRFFPTR